MIIIFAHQKGGVGKSTIAVNLAYQLKNSFADTVIYDLDSQYSSKLFNKLRVLNKFNTIDCYTQNDIELDDLVKRYKYKKDNILIIDSGGYDSNINRLALIKADIIITPVGTSQIELFGLQKFRKLLQEASDILPFKIKTYILINNVDGRSKKSILELQNYINSNSEYFILIKSILYTRADYRYSYSQAKTITEYSNNSKASSEIINLTNEIISLVNNY